MRRALIIGYGGSGTKTAACMMDQLKVSLSERMPAEALAEAPAQRAAN